MKINGLFRGFFVLLLLGLILRVGATIWTWHREEPVPFKDRPPTSFRWCQPGEVFIWSNEETGMGKCGKIYYGAPAVKLHE